MMATVPECGWVQIIGSSWSQQHTHLHLNNLAWNWVVTIAIHGKTKFGWLSGKIACPSNEEDPNYQTKLEDWNTMATQLDGTQNCKFVYMVWNLKKMR